MTDISGYALAKRGTDTERLRAERNVRQLAQDDQDAAYLLEVLGLIEASADVPATPHKKLRQPAGTNCKQHNERLALFWEGLCDREIGERLGVTGKTIANWRRPNGLECNPDPKLAAKPTEQARLEAHARGLTDAQIAAIEGVRRDNIKQWRYHRKLPRNGRA